MKKLIVLPFLFLMSIPVFAQDKALFTGKLSEIEHFGSYIEFFGLDASLPSNNMFYAIDRGYLNEGQTCKSAVLLKLFDPRYVWKVTYLDKPTDKENVEWIPVKESRIKQIREYFDKFDEIQTDREEFHFKKPPLKVERISGEFLLGEALGIVVCLPSALVGYQRIGHESYGAFRGFAIGYPIGSSLGVYIIGKIGNETGSNWTTLLGSLVGPVIFLFFSSIDQFSVDPDNPLNWIGLSVLSNVGAIIGFNLTRRYETPHASGAAFINFGDGQMSLAVPRIYFRYNPFEGRTLIQNIDLVRVDF